MTVLAVTEWPEAAIAIAGIAFITIVLSVLIWQIFSTGKLGLAGRHDKEYRKLVDELSAVQRDTTAELQKANDALAAPGADRRARAGAQGGRSCPQGRRVRLPTGSYVVSRCRTRSMCRSLSSMPRR